ncbi:unnamed protein product [Prunus brigantina]
MSWQEREGAKRKGHKPIEEGFDIFGEQSWRRAKEELSKKEKKISTIEDLELPSPSQNL